MKQNLRNYEEQNIDSKPVFSEKYVGIEMKSYNKENNNGKVLMKRFKVPLSVSNSA